MKLFRKKLFKLGNKGLSMVELICGIAILGVIGTAVTGVMVVSADSYKRGSTEAEVQQEAQLVANQIGDLLIDATADVSLSADEKVLTIKQGGKAYTVTFNDGEKKLFYQEHTVNADDTLTATSTSQLMAEGLKEFKIDISDYSSSGYARLNMKFENAKQSYPAVFTIAARNKDTENATAVAANILVTTEWLLEPYQSKSFDASVTGLDNTAVEWSFIASPTDPDTKIVTEGNRATLEIGRNETSHSVRLKVATNQKDGSGNPMAEKNVHVYIRRVNNIAIVDNHVSGVPLMNGCVYDLTAILSGSNMPQFPGAAFDADYVDPYGVTWTVSPSSAGSFTPDPADPSNPAKRRFTLTQDIPMGSTVVVTAKADHPAGTNKKGTPYGSVVATWSLYGTYMGGTPGSEMERGSDAEQGQFTAYDTLQQQLIATLGNGTYEQRDEYRFREVDSAGNPVGNWVGWYDNPEDMGSAVNIRPRVSLCMDYLKPYEVQVRFGIWKDGVKVWPLDPSIPESVYTYSGIMKKVQVAFESPAFLFTYAVGGTSPMPLQPGNDQTLLTFKEGVAIKDDVIQGNIRFILQKETSPGVWTDNPSDLVIEDRTDGTCIADISEAAKGGNYRILVWLDNVQLNTTDGVNYDETGRVDYDMYDLSNPSNSEGIFYFSVI